MHWLHCADGSTDPGPDSSTDLVANVRAHYVAHRRADRRSYVGSQSVRGAHARTYRSTD